MSAVLGQPSHHHSEVRVVEFLVRELGVDINSGKPASVAGVSAISTGGADDSRVIPAAQKVILPDGFVGFLELDHVLKRLNVSFAEIPISPHCQHSLWSPFLEPEVPQRR